MMANDLLASGFTVAAVGVVVWLTFACSTLSEGFPRLRISQGLGIVAISALAMLIATALRPPDRWVLIFIFPALVILVTFAAMWSREFRLLMDRRADEFPDRLDKLAWIFVLTAFAPAGVWVFRSYRRARWPTTRAVEKHPLDVSEPGPGGRTGFDASDRGIGKSPRPSL